MYEAHFRLKHRPFRSTPVSTSYYSSASHELILARALEALGGEEGLCLLTGLPGTGKTLLCHRLLGRLSEQTNLVFLTNSHFADLSSLLQALLYDLSLPYEGRTEQELRLILTDFLLNQFGEGRRTVVVIDEAQHLTPCLLEELRLWCNLETEDRRAIQVVLAAQPGLLETLRQPELAALSQRLATRLHLEPLSLEESAAYLNHQVRAAGGRPENIFADEALEILCGAAKGLPRMLNHVANQALAVAFQAKVATVDAEVAIEAVLALGLELEAEASAEPHFGTRTAVASPADAIALANSEPRHSDALKAPKRQLKPRKARGPAFDQVVNSERTTDRRPA